MSDASDRDTGGKSPTSAAARRILGSNLRRFRTNLGLSQAGLSGKSGIRQSKIAQVELGNVNVTLETMSRLANALGVPVAALFEADE